MNYIVPKNQVQLRKIDGGMANPTLNPFMAAPARTSGRKAKQEKKKDKKVYLSSKGSPPISRVIEVELGHSSQNARQR